MNAGFNAREDGLKAANRILKIIDGPLNEMDPFNSNGSKPDSLEGFDTFKNCTFADPTRPNKIIYYPSKENDETGFSLSFDQKQALAFVGKSGCGYVCLCFIVSFLLFLYQPSVSCSI